MSNKDIFTSVIRVKGDAKHKVVPVKSSDKVDVSLWKEFSKVIGRIYTNTPINTGDIICKNILNTGIDIICSKRIDNE
ncbi:CxxC motif-containing protein [Clostridium moniliforme]|uniref:CxxC motif-containing protein n=1 Tax=Clostridium moniliforme TaxID=39489 RepID=A0ABS4F3S7_9CLOT|nr:DUF1667 domain-containing protein [Clostridium moniliforme]MBP1890910.1 CxxC motif-containing protein [Clostridium moniliforme]